MRDLYNITDKVETSGKYKFGKCECGKEFKVKYRYASFSCDACNAILTDSLHGERTPIEETDGQSTLGQFM